MKRLVVTALLISAAHSAEVHAVDYLENPCLQHRKKTDVLALELQRCVRYAARTPKAKSENIKDLCRSVYGQYVESILANERCEGMRLPEQGK